MSNNLNSYQNLIPGGGRESDNRPNIVFILADQWRGDCLSAYGHPVVQTPHLDELANRGTLFTSAYSAIPTCIAARACIWTGQRPTTLGWLGYPNKVNWCFETTLMHELKMAGYQTGCIGKTHFWPRSARLGFETRESYEGYLESGSDYVSDYHEWLFERTGGKIREQDHGLQDNSWIARPSHLPEELHNNTWVVTRSIEFLRRRDRTRPFFLNVSFHRPHPPIDPPQAFYDMYKDVPLEPVPVGDWAREYDVPVTGANVPHGHLPDRIIDHTRRAYYAQIAHIDNQIGRLVMRMIHMGLLQNTWFVFTSDHGEMLGDHHHFCKSYAYEGSARIPLIVCPPRGTQERGMIVCDKPVSHYDIMPTVLTMAGAPIPESVEGNSLLPLCAEMPDVNWRDYLHGEHSSMYYKENAMQFLTDGREKYIWNPVTGREHLFNLHDDPQEMHDLVSVPGWRERLEFWRLRMIEELLPRTDDGLSDGRKLIAGKGLPIIRVSKI